MINSKRLNLIFIVELVLIGLVVLGYVSRQAVIGWTLVLVAYVLMVPLEESMLFFIRSIPLFVAIPFTPNFDSFNIWRILSVLIFFKWLFRLQVALILFLKVRLFLAKPLLFFRHHKVFTSLAVLSLLALLSALVAPQKVVALKRIIYFANLGLIGIVIYDLANKNKSFTERAIKNIAIPTILVTLVGFAQLVSTYFIDIYQFADFWTLTGEKNLFGSQWAAISREANTWFAYFGDQLSLRLFSLFPDSHSFPIFLLLGLPAIFAIAVRRVIERADNDFRSMLKTRGSLLVVFIPLGYLAAILSGTRGIWAGSLAAVLMIFGVILLLNRHKAVTEHKNTFKYISSYLILFFILFSIAYPIIASPQFLVSKGDSLLLHNRVRSIIDFGETSNAERIRIWKLSLQSITKHPVLGVGIGNFPVVLEQDVALAKAGSTAHNLYLHIAAEMGILALVISLVFLWLLIRKLYFNFISTPTPWSEPRYSVIGVIYFGAMLIYLPWVLAYSLTDPAIFDERAFLLFAITCALIFANKKSSIARLKDGLKDLLQSFR